MKDESYRVRENAVVALGRIGDPRAIEPLIATIKDEESSVRLIAVQVLGVITGQDFGEDQDKWRKWWDENKDEILKDR